MEYNRAISSLKSEVQTQAVLGDDGKLYIPIGLLDKVLQYAFAMGFDEGRRDLKNSNGFEKSVDKYIEKEGVLEYMETFPSLHEAARSVRGDRSNLTKAIKKDGKFKGFIFKFTNNLKLNTNEITESSERDRNIIPIRDDIGNVYKQQLTNRGTKRRKNGTD